MSLEDKPDSRPVSYGDLVVARWHDGPTWKFGIVGDYGPRTIPMHDIESAQHVVWLLDAENVRVLLGQMSDGAFKPVASWFPDVTTGDFSPEDTLALEKALTEALVSWLTSNYPGQ